MLGRGPTHGRPRPTSTRGGAPGSYGPRLSAPALSADGLREDLQSPPLPGRSQPRDVQAQPWLRSEGSAADRQRIVAAVRLRGRSGGRASWPRAMVRQLARKVDLLAPA